MPSYKTRAIVLKRRNQGESDRVLTLFSRDLGRISVIAKGARRSKSKLSGGIELFTESDFTLTTGKTFEILTESSVANHYLADETDLEKIKLAHFFSEVIFATTIENQPSETVYEALTNSLSMIGQLDSRIVIIYFTSKILEVSGSYPELSVCLDCHQKPSGEIRFSHTAGGIFCDECRPVVESLYAIDRDTVKLWRFIMESTPARLAKLNINDNDLLNEASDIALTFLCNMTGRDYHTLSTLRLT